jgi:hypothetical protein
MYDKALQRYCNEHGYYINPAGVIELTRAQAAEQKRAGYLEKSIHGPGLVWLVAGDHGVCLISEGKHFIIK